MKAWQAALAIATAALVIVLVPGGTGPYTTSVAPATTLTASYNPAPLAHYHAPLSGMAMIGLAHATPRGDAGLSAARLTLAGGVTSVPVNGLRFIRDGSYVSQNEPSLGVDYANPLHIVGGDNDMRWFFCPALAAPNCPTGWTFSLSGFSVSANGGKSLLKSNDLPGLLVTEHNGSKTQQGFLLSWGDPSVAAGVGGHFFYASLAIDPNSAANGVELSKSNGNLWSSTNACATPASEPWKNPCWHSVLVFGNLSTKATSFEDKERIAIDRDPASPFYGDIYVSWDHFYSTGESAAFLARCTPSLACTMLSGGGKPLLSGHDVFVAGTTPTVGTNGYVHVTWCNYGTATTVGPVVCPVRNSPPGGTSFGPRVVIVSYEGPGTMFPNFRATEGFATEQFRVPNFGTIAADTGPGSTDVYYAVTVCTQGNYFGFFSPAIPGNCGHSSILFSRSLDNGRTWSTPSVISKPAVNVFPFVSVDPQTGAVVVTYYSSLYDRWNHRLDIVAAVSPDDGASWHWVRVTSVSDEPNANPTMFNYLTQFGGAFAVPQYGDYFESLALHGTLWALGNENYQSEQGTFQTDPWLFHAPEGVAFSGDRV